MSLPTPKGLRLHLGIFGRRNVGKSSLLNALAQQNVSLVSEVAGTTTDPVEKPMELLPLGPVLFIDTAGIDDEGTLGALRVEKTRQVIERTDLAIIVTDKTWGTFEEYLAREMQRREIPTLVVFSKSDLRAAQTQIEQVKTVPVHGLQVASLLGDSFFLTQRHGGTEKNFNPENAEVQKDTEGLNSASSVFPCIPSSLRASVPPCETPQKIRERLLKTEFPEIVALEVSAQSGAGMSLLHEMLIKLVPEDFLAPPPIVTDIVAAGSFLVLVVPIDKEAPKGRLILPQVQTIRDILDGDCFCAVVRENRLASLLQQMPSPPALVITDSQAFHQVAQMVPPEIPLTSFSILFARQKGDFSTLLDGARALLKLPKNKPYRILIAEGCSHRPIEEDIGTEKIPRMLRARFGNDLTIAFCRGHDFPFDTISHKSVKNSCLGIPAAQRGCDMVEGEASHKTFDLVIHCGACMGNRREMLTRILACRAAGVPITNYGLAIAAMVGILDRAAAPLEKSNCGVS